MANINIEQMIVGLILLIVAIIVIFQIVASSAPELIIAADNISSSGLPLAGLFASNGVVLLIFMAAVLIGIVIVALKGGFKKK